MASVAAAVGAGVPDAGGLTAGADEAFTRVGLGGGGAVEAVADGRTLADAVGVALEPEGEALAGGPCAGLLVGATDGGEVLSGLAAGAAGTAITNSVVPDLSGVGPIATAWLALDGDRTSELGTVGRLARLRATPASGGQSGSAPVGQTLLTSAVTRDKPPDALVTTQVTSELATVIGVTAGPNDGTGWGLPEAWAIPPGGVPLPANRLGPTIAITRTRATPPLRMATGPQRRGSRFGPPGWRACSRSRAALVRAHRSRGGSIGGKARNATRSASYAAASARQAGQPARCSSRAASSIGGRDRKS